MDKLLVYIPEITPRSEFIFSLLIRNIIGARMEFTGRPEDYRSYNGPKIEYAGEPSGEGIFICSHGLLQESSVVLQNTDLFRAGDLPAFFKTPDDRSAFPFDLFAASFYLVSRYEEYLSFTPDRYGRFRAKDSIASTGKFLELPVVNLWAELLRKRILESYPDLQFCRKKFRFIPSIDVDHAYAYKQRPVERTIGGYGRSVIHGDWKKIGERTRVLLGMQQDPFDLYDFIREIHDRYQLDPLYFVLYADYGRNDNNVSLHGRKFRQLIRDLDSSKRLGIHPSLKSGKNPKLFKSEIRDLATALGRDIRISRQHFLKVSFPETYRRLLKNGIHEDYSLGYASTPGFRAGIADPFPFFDLLRNKETNLIIHPVTLMDVTMKDYCRMDPERAIRYGRSLADTIKALKGEFLSVWHNESFDETGRWKGWRRVYEDLLRYATASNSGE